MRFVKTVKFVKWFPEKKMATLLKIVKIPYGTHTIFL